MNYPKTILWSGVIAAFCFTGAAYAQSSSVDKDATQTNQVTASQDGALPFNNLLAYNDAAAQQGGEGQDVQSLGTIEATGLAFSMKQSLAAEKTSDAQVSAISATDIGRLPATNVAQALRNVPGVTIDESFPLIERTTINGIAGTLNNTLLNGHLAYQPPWLIGNNSSRGFNYSVLPTESVSSLKVYKSYQANLMAGAIGGTVVVETPKPLDQKPGSVVGHVGYIYNSQRGDGAPNGAVLYSTHNAAGSFGFSVGASYMERKVNRHGSENWSWNGSTVADKATATDSVVKTVYTGTPAAYQFNEDWKTPPHYDGSGILHPGVQAEDSAGNKLWLVASNRTLLNQFRAGKFGDGSQTVDGLVNAANWRPHEKQTGVTANFQLKPNDALSMALRLVYRQTEVNNYNNSMYAMGFAGGNASSVYSISAPDANNVSQQIKVGYGTTFDNAPCTFTSCAAKHGAGYRLANPGTVWWDHNNRKSKIKTKSGALNIDYSGQGWGIKGLVGARYSANEDNTGIVANFRYYGPMTISAVDGYSAGKYSSEFHNGDYWTTHPVTGASANANQTFFVVKHFPYKTQNTFAKADVHVDLDGWVNKLEFGVSLSDVAQSQTRNQHNVYMPAFALSSKLNLDYTQDFSQFSGRYSDYQHRPGFTDADWEQRMVAEAVSKDGTGLYKVGPRNDAVWQGGTWDFTQQRTGAYVQADFTNYNNLRGNFGLRFVHISNTAHGPVLNVLGGYDWTETSGSNNEVLPAVNITYTPSADVVLRGGIAKVIAFNAVQDIAQGWTSNSDVAGNLQASAGNPSVKPFAAVATTLSGAWYFTPQSAVSVNVFNYNITNYVHKGTKTINHQNPYWNTFTAAQQSAMGSQGCSSSGMCPFDTTVPISGDTAKLTGVTLAYSQGFGDSGFGLRASYTSADGQNSSGGPMAYTSRDSYKITPYYSKGAWDASISYQYRSPHIGAGYVGAAPPTLYMDHTNLNLQVAYTINDQFDVRLSGINLQNERVKGMATAHPGQLQQKYYTGAMYQVQFGFHF